METLSDTTKGIIALWMIPGLGPVRIQTLWEKLGSIDAIFNTPHQRLAELLGVNPSVTSGIPWAMESKEFIKELELINKHEVHVLDFTDTAYPAALKQIHNAPPIIYLKGSKDLESGFMLAFVGSRKASFAGQNMCRKLIKRLSVIKPETVIVSGLALGIDTAAHSAALEAGLNTIAVLANGLSDIYPARNRKLATNIQNKGTVLSEFPMTTKPVAGNFPLRNRIISGLSKGVIVIEAGERSGATITAGYAIEQNRELFALPGPADSNFYKGTNRLIQRSQAKLVIEAEDILEEFETLSAHVCYDDSKKDPQIPQDLSVEEQQVLTLIKNGITQKDRLIDQSDLPIQRLLAALTSLDLKGLIVTKPGATYEAVQF
ncbi:MAG: DNA-processing protein DprA [Proteobacteria bacterium]|nr:DNA-processing protein DprA [Pseudomonadota bacterium]